MSNKAKSRVLTREPVLFCFCGPVASGKSTLCRELENRLTHINLSISSTTRAPRVGEVDGQHYHFLSREDFEKRIDANQFVEWAEFNGELYGTDATVIAQSLSSNRDLLLDIDTQGVELLRKRYPDRLVVIFVMFPSLEELKRRISQRGSQGKRWTSTRIEIAAREVETLLSPNFSDYILLNDSLPRAVAEAESIVVAERQRLKRLSSDCLRQLSEIPAEIS